MKLTVIPSDGAVYKDGVAFSNLDISAAPGNVHALQWDGVKGWIEYTEDAESNKPANEKITELPQWALSAVEKWVEASDAFQAAEQARIAALEAQQIPVSVTGEA